MIVVVFILSFQHSGSTWLNAVLGSTSWAAALGEYYRPFRFPGHVACRLCEADGLAECVTLHGIQDVPALNAFDFAAERLGKSVLIDASKDIDWCRTFMSREGIEPRLIHLVRNPGGVIDSLARRHPDQTLAQHLATWEARNREIEAFIAESGKPALLAPYDELADDPDLHMPAVCDFIGHAWEPQAVEYWRKPYHGLGGNGASSLYLRNRVKQNFRTGDDQFYADLDKQPTAADRRWLGRIPATFAREAVTTPYARSLQARLGTDWMALLEQAAGAGSKGG